MDNVACEGQALTAIGRSPSLTGRLDAREQELTDNLAAVKEAKELLDSEPKLKRLLDLLAKLCIH